MVKKEIQKERSIQETLAASSEIRQKAENRDDEESDQYVPLNSIAGEVHITNLKSEHNRWKEYLQTKILWDIMRWERFIDQFTQNVKQIWRTVSNRFVFHYFQSLLFC